MFCSSIEKHKMLHELVEWIGLIETCQRLAEVEKSMYIDVY